MTKYHVKKPLTDAGFLIHSVLANRRLHVRIFIRNPDGMSFLIDRHGKIYSPDLRSGQVYSSHTDISEKTLNSLLRMKAITEEQAEAHIKARKEAIVWQALLDIEEVGCRLGLKIYGCVIEE